MNVWFRYKVIYHISTQKEPFKNANIQKFAIPNNEFSPFPFFWGFIVFIIANFLCPLICAFSLFNIKIFARLLVVGFGKLCQREDFCQYVSVSLQSCASNWHKIECKILKFFENFSRFCARILPKLCQWHNFPKPIE